MKLWTPILAFSLVSWCLFGTAQSFVAPSLDIALQQAKHETNTNPTFFPRYVSVLAEHHVWKNFSVFLRSNEVSSSSVYVSPWSVLLFVEILAWFANLCSDPKNSRSSKERIILLYLFSVQRYETNLEPMERTNHPRASAPTNQPAIEDDPLNQYFYESISKTCIRQPTQHIKDMVIVEEDLFATLGDIEYAISQHQEVNMTVVVSSSNPTAFANSVLNQLEQMVYVESLHIFTHAESGRLLSKDLDILNVDILEQHKSIWKEIGSRTSSILLYGCNISSGEKGRYFLQTLASITNTNTYASSNPTGSSAKGGDWILEDSVKFSFPGITFAPSFVAAPSYDGLLQTCTPDNTPPTFTSCPTNISKNTDSGVCTASTNFSLTATDNCTASPTINLVTGQASGSNFPLGTTSESFTATDAANNVSSPCNFTVTVADSEAPTFTSCPTNISKNTDSGVCTASTSFVVTAKDNCTASPTITLVTGQASGSNFPLGSTSESFTAKDAANNVSSPCNFTVTVADNEAPTFTSCPTNISKNTDPGVCTALTSFVVTAKDNCTASPTITLGTGQASGTNFPKGTTNESFTAKDAANNVSSPCNFTVTVNDAQVPTAKCKADFTVNLLSTAPADVTILSTQVDNGSTDNCALAGPPTASPLTFTCNDIRSNKVTLTATDTSSNTKTCSLQVTVADITPPVAKCNSLAPIDLDSTGNYILKASDVDGGSFDNCPGNLKITVSPLRMTCFYTKSQVPVILTADDQHNPPVTCSAKVIVRDVTAPIPSCQNVTVQLNSAGSAVLAPSTVGSGSTDECGVGSLSLSRTTFSCTDVGSVTVTMKVTDVNLNTSTCDASVTVEDKVAPAIVCQNINLTLSSTTPTTITASQLVNSSFDACGAVTYSASTVSFGCPEIGNNSVTVTGRDVNGNTSTCISIVTVTASCVGVTCGSNNVCGGSCGNSCDDGNPCNGIESCNSSNVCVSTPVLCGNGCLPGSGCLSQCQTNSNCTPFTCIGGFCKGLSFIGGKCDVGDNSDCVPPYNCSTYSDTVGNYVCGGMGAPCTNNQDQNCKSPLVCLKGTCQYPLPSGSACGEAADCQHGQCIGVCSSNGRRCYDVSECPGVGATCSGICGGSNPWP